MDKCFCHLNGYAVKDATARKQIEELEKSIVKSIEVSELPSENIEEDAIYKVPASGGINWDGDTTNREVVENFGGFINLYKVSDNVLTPDELLGKQLGMTSKDGEVLIQEIKSNMIADSIEGGNGFLIGAEDIPINLPYVLVINEPSTDYPQSRGIYFSVMPDGSCYTSSLSIPGETTYKKYIYANGEWVEIGGSEVDLSNYPTREEMENAINEASSGDSGSGLYTLSINQSMGNYREFREDVDGQFSKLINDLHAMGKPSVTFILESTNDKKQYMLTSLYEMSGEKTFYKFQFVNEAYLSNSQFNLTCLSIYGTWTDGVFTASSANWDLRGDSRPYLPKDNTTKYVPSAQYHPATKGYVDEKVASAGGSKGFYHIEMPLTGAINLEYNDNYSYAESHVALSEECKTIMMNLITKIKEDGVSQPVIMLDNSDNDTSTPRFILLAGMHYMDISTTEEPNKHQYLFSGTYNHIQPFYQVINDSREIVEVQLGVVGNEVNGVFTATAIGLSTYWRTIDLKSYTGYSNSKTQVLKNVNGTLTWVDE